MKRWLAAGVGALVMWLGGVAVWIALGPPISGAERGETAIVLGAAVIGDQPSPVFAARLDHAATLYRTGRARRILVTGGRSPEDGVSEAEAGATYLAARGVPRAEILGEDQSRTTHQNLTNAQRILGPRAAQPVLIVSDPLHLRRAMAMAVAEGLDAFPAPTPTSRYRSLGTQIPFLAREVWFIHVHWLAGV
ncbi:YdcF family protein [Erythrobacter sp. BLCC-B19]|uniref:YdcF family protein n=1 Tax=Erythrobacter sp. BLCC-B19 TaxID=3025315 RepID=UPI00235DF5BC|nr:YdcF family protein [Erythrobacter sp. BLCC-B19]WDA40810.1 YdcF family protein [Erythrobacter sp. BLCC-B19]